MKKCASIIAVAISTTFVSACGGIGPNNLDTPTSVTGPAELSKPEIMLEAPEEPAPLTKTVRALSPEWRAEAEKLLDVKAGSKEGTWEAQNLIYKSTRHYVYTLYKRLLERPSEEAGLRFWMGVVEQKNFSFLKQSFIKAAESELTYRNDHPQDSGATQAYLRTLGIKDTPVKEEDLEKSPNR